ncbi:hypothetical protein O9G_001238 [Rozella allomycis CSF55]|uniref:Cysteine proteinase n=1 Tax=Rozella allomycis (strain CSF55) TaxID=988480 RepID=A0A075AXP1_ROZAC|nr:hypothetical protein O9G_001238 [Rozella allomycis CSF55]|eukprot:EPZ33487.1 hypothetical protein O9G_001238 [Rozella allomycis CSF55]
MKRKLADENGIENQIQCPYLGTIDRKNLDFDHERICSVTLSNTNIYICLVCGKYLQGKSSKSQAYFHCVNEDHHVFAHLESKRIFCLPDGYEVQEPSLEDIKYNILPQYTKEDFVLFDRKCFDLQRKEYVPGCLGINNIKANDYVNVVIHALSHVQAFRNEMLLGKFSKRLTSNVSDLIKKLWNPKAFRANVSPHELMATIADASEMKFHSTKQSDPMDFLTWLLNSMHRELKKKNNSIIHECFRGFVKVDSQPIQPDLVDDATFVENSCVSPFLYLSLDLPPTPLYRDENEENIIPQVSLALLLEKFNGTQVTEIGNFRKTYTILESPDYLIFHFKRFIKNNWSNERNPTIVNYSVDSLGLPVNGEIVNYRLSVNIAHDDGCFKVHVFNEETKNWYLMQDLAVREIAPEMIFLSESYIQIWKKIKH